MPKRTPYPGTLPPWHASKKQKTNESAPKSVAARMAKLRQNKNARRSEANERLQRLLESEAQGRYIPDSD